LVIVLVSTVALTSNYAKSKLEVSNAEAELIIQRLLYSSHGIAYHDPLSNRVYPGIIDTTKLENSFLEKTFFYGKENKHLGAQIMITEPKTDKKIASVIYNGKVYTRIAEEGAKGAGGVDVKRKEISVLVKEKEKLVPAIAKITLVTSRSS
jgi:hypothetical protein